MIHLSLPTFRKMFPMKNANRAAVPAIVVALAVAGCAASPGATTVCEGAPPGFVDAVNEGADGSGVLLAAGGAALSPAEESASGALQYLVGKLEGAGVDGNVVAFVVGGDASSPGPIMAVNEASAEFFDWPLVDGSVTPAGAVAAMRACGG